MKRIQQAVLLFFGVYIAAITAWTVFPNSLPIDGFCGSPADFAPDGHAAPTVCMTFGEYWTAAAVDLLRGGSSAVIAGVATLLYTVASWHRFDQ